MSRASDINQRRRLRYGQAVMLGITFEDSRGGSEYSRARWSFKLPEHLQPQDRGYASGYFIRRWECVDRALRVVGVIE